MGDKKREIKIVKERPEDLKRETECRVNRMDNEFSKDLTLKLFPNDEGYDQIISQVKIPFTALCEHHRVSFEGYAYVAYIPDKWFVGLSKLARVVEFYLNPTIETLQERATHQILKTMEEINAKGVMVVLKAKHNCVCYRGVKKPSWTITSAVSGAFKKEINPREEFLKLLNL